jgi:hypothetical protein
VLCGTEEVLSNATRWQKVLFFTSAATIIKLLEVLINEKKRKNHVMDRKREIRDEENTK